MKRILLLTLTLLLLTGCSLIPKEYRTVKPHEEAGQIQMPDAAQVSDREELKQAILGFIKAGSPEGSIRTVSYDGDVEKDLVQVVYETARQEPLGAYAVDYIDHNCVKIVNYYEISLRITYRRTPRQIAAIQPAYDAEQLRQQVERALRSYVGHLAMEVTEDQEYDIDAITQQYCAANAAHMVEIPGVSVAVYPDSGPERIVEVEFVYEHTPEELAQMKQALEESVSAAAEYIRYRQQDREKIKLLYTYLTQRFTYESGQTATPVYSALCEGIADPAGLARGLQLICAKAGVECYAVSGLRDGESYVWSIISDDGDFRHVDLSWCILENNALRLMTDWEMNRYYWNAQDYPACIVEEPVQVQPEAPTEEQTTEEEETTE